MTLRCLPRRSRVLLAALAVAGWLGFSLLLMMRRADTDRSGKTNERGLSGHYHVKQSEPLIPYFDGVLSGTKGFCHNAGDVVTAGHCPQVLNGSNLKLTFENFDLRDHEKWKRLSENAVIGNKNNTLYSAIKKSSNVKSEFSSHTVQVIDLVRRTTNRCFQFDSVPLLSWKTGNVSFCSGNFQGFTNEFALLHDVIVDRTYCANSDRGGEQIRDVMHQEESVEYLQCRSGFFRLSGCGKSEKISYNFNQADHLNNWLSSIQLDSSLSDSSSNVKILNNNRTGTVMNQRKDCGGEFTIATQRYEYANLYHTMTDWYSAFLTMVFFNRTASETNILLMDGHPVGALDSVWSKLFRSAILVKDLPSSPVYFKNLAWAIIGYNTPMKIFPTPQIPPLYEEFRAFFLSAYSIHPASIHRLDCSRISVQLIYRRDYVAHPRNPSGHVHRQIANEKELEKGLLELNPSFIINGAQVDNYTMEEQIRMVTEADILIGMHGAGMTHALFLAHNTAAVIELQPSYTTNKGNHYMAIAGWRGLAYERWTNTDRKRELAGHSTIVPPAEINGLLKVVVAQICPKSKS